MASDASDIEKATDRGFEDAVVGIDEKWWLRGSIAQVPFIGSYINEMLSSKAGKIVARRWDELYRDMRESLKSLDESKINKDFFKSEELFDLLLKALDATARTRNQDKIRAYAQTLVSASMTSKEDEEDPELYLNIVAELLPVEWRVLTALYDLQKGIPAPIDRTARAEWEEEHRWQNLAETSGLSEHTLEMILQRLERTGLVTSLTGFGVGGDHHFVISDLLKDLIVFLEKSNPS